MPAKSKKAQVKSTKGSKKTTSKKAVKKPLIKKKASPKKAKITDEQFEEWFFKMDGKYFVQLSKEWNEKKLKIKLPELEGYDQWLNHFKTLSPNKIKMLARTGQDILPTEGYAALARWHDIISNPARIDKIHQSGLTTEKGNDKSILDYAHSNDRLGVLKATRDKLAAKLEKGAAARDTASLARELTEVMTQIADYEKRQGPKKTTKLGKLIDSMPDVKKKRPSKNGSGSRNTSFKSRVTIGDLEKAGG